MVIGQARGSDGLHLPTGTKKKLDNERLPVLSPIPGFDRRGTRNLALQRNRIVAAAADAIAYAHITPDGQKAWSLDHEWGNGE